MFKLRKNMSNKEEKFCNMCSMTLYMEPGHSSGMADFNHGLVEAKVIGQYMSPIHGGLNDLQDYTFSLCEFCLNHLFQKFVIPPDVNFHCPNEKGFFTPKEKYVKNLVERSNTYSHWFDNFIEKERIRSSKRK